MNDINRFIEMHELYYPVALMEIKNGHKRSHWMWYIFPQLRGLGNSERSFYYGISNKEEAIEYMNNPYLKNNMLEICNELYKLNDSIRNIFGYPDYIKLKSCMTLFEYVCKEENIFSEILQKFYDGSKDEKTIEILKKETAI